MFKGARVRRYSGLWRLRRRFCLPSYEETVQTLYSHIHSFEWNDSITAQEKLSATKFFADELEINYEALSVIHIAGTKGKGSTATMVERILFNHGFKTGLFTSPHLVHPRERFRLNGSVITKSDFVQSFWHVHNTLKRNKEAADRLSFFAFLTLLALHIFQEAGVNAAIMEAGIGGRWDSTNIIPCPSVTGITRIDLDHCKLLGDTIQKIAKDKAGIMKADIPIFVTKQSSDAMLSFQEEAVAKSLCLQEVPSLAELMKFEDLPRLGMVGDHQFENASLAISLAHNWINQRQDQETLSSDLDNLPKETLKGLETAVSSCRGQIIQISPKVQLYFDIAHTPLSVDSSAKYFKSISEGHDRLLVFNCANERDPVELLKQIKSHFTDISYFMTCPFAFAKPSCGHWTLEDLCEKHSVSMGSFQPSGKSKWHTWLCQFANAIFTIPQERICAYSSPEECIDQLLELTKSTDRMTSCYIVGSAYLCGNMLEQLEKKGIIDTEKIL